MGNDHDKQLTNLKVIVKYTDQAGREVADLKQAFRKISHYYDKEDNRLRSIINVKFDPEAVWDD